MDRQLEGQLEQESGRWQLRFTRKLPHPPERVWRALTEPDELAAWFPSNIEGERAAGAALRFVFPQGEAPPMEGEMIRYEPTTTLEFRWGSDTLRFGLERDGTGTILTLVDTFDELGKAARDGAGWHVCLGALTAFLEGADATSARAVLDRWREVQPSYIERFGPEASTIGPPETLMER